MDTSAIGATAPPSAPLVPPAVHDGDLRVTDPGFATLPPIAFAPLTLDIAPDIAPDIPRAYEPDEAAVEVADETAPVSVRTVPAPPVHLAFAPAEIEPAEMEPAEMEPAGVASISAELPVIVEATPVPDGDPLDLVPRLPSLPTPDQRVAATVAALADIASVPAATTPRRRRSRRGIKLVLTFLVLAGLVAAGIVVGRPYLFPADWDDTTAPYAEAVGASRGIEFVEPLAVTAESSAELAARSAAALRAPWHDLQPDLDAQWRALGLASGAVTDAAIARQLDGWRSALYSTDDGQVYHDAAVTGAQLEAQIVQSMTAAALDQDFAWSTDQAARTLDDQAATSAEVLRQTRDVQLASTFATPLDPIDPTLVDGLPSVLAYRALAPHMYAEFANTASGETNALEGIGTAGPGPFTADEPVLAADAVMIESDVVAATPPVALDRSFWFLTFAGFLDARTAFAASEAIVENAVTTARRGDDLCAYATFSGSGVDETEVLRDALSGWSASVPPEFASSFSVLDDGTLQLVSCDPGVALPTPANPAAHRALISWRIAELATIEAIVATGSDDLDADFAFAWPFVTGSSVAADLAALAPSTPPAEFAAAARAAIGAVFAPSS